MAQDLLIAGFGNILRKKIGRGELSVQEAGETVDASRPVRSSPVLRIPSFELLLTWQSHSDATPTTRSLWRCPWQNRVAWSPPTRR